MLMKNDKIRLAIMSEINKTFAELQSLIMVYSNFMEKNLKKTEDYPEHLDCLNSFISSRLETFQKTLNDYFKEWEHETKETTE